MFLLPRRLRRFLEKKRKGRNSRVFKLDGQSAMTLISIAEQQRRPKEDVYAEVIRAGIHKVLAGNVDYAKKWDLLTPREQEVTALICLGYRSDQMAEILAVSYDTVRSHSKHIYEKFSLSRKELRQALQDWNFMEWWKNTHA
jgi:DNA-binding CsgD family transcriptional regulator